jgi:hypothetical protein
MTVTVLPSNPVIIAQFDPICQSGSTQLSISAADPYGAAAFQWQTSSNNVTFTDIAGATNTSYITPVISTTTWYRLKLMNAGNLCTQSSYSVVVRHPQITGVTPGYHCGEGTVTLGATATDGTPAWYAGASGGTSLGTGNSFTTPSLSSTTSYYVGALTNATATVQVGNGSATSGVFESPFDYYAGGVKNQYLIMATDLLNAGLIAGNLTALAFDVVSSDGTTFQGFNLSIGQTLQSSLYIDFLTGLTNVYSTTAPAGVTPVNGIFTINFSTPFAWDGTSNIVVETCWSNNNTGAPASGAMVKNDLTSYLSHIKIGLNNENPSDVCSFLYAPSHGIDCPKMIFTENTQCESTRTPVVATIHTPVQVVPAILPANVCAAHPTALSVANVTPGYSYSWNPGNLSGAAQTVYPDTTTAYTVTATLTGTTCTTSAPVTATVLNSPATITITPATSVISPGAIQPLTATGGQVTNAVILSENFNGVTNNWTTINNSAGGNVSAAAWTLRPNNYYYAGSQTVTFNSNDNSQFYLTNSDAQGAGSITSTILQSPVFSTVGYISGQVSFFHHFMEYPGSYGNVEASTNGTTWTTLQTYTAMAGSVNGFTGATVPLTTPFLNQPAVYVRFLFYGEWAWWWAIDNVTITGTEQVGKVVWSPLTALYTDAAATIPYTGAQLSTVYSKPAATITYTATAVNPANGCDRSANATVSIQSAIPPIIYVVGVNIGSGQNLCYNATSTITVTDFNVQGGGIATFIAGEKIILIPETRVFPAGYLHAKIAPAGPFCSQTKMTEVIATGDIPSATEFAWFSLYPNPTNGNFTLVQKGDRAFSNIRVEVYSTRGEKILTESMIGEKDHEFRFSEMPPAMYFVKVVADDYVETIKLVKTR